MHICDKCRKFNHCYSKNGYEGPDIAKRLEVEANGCKSYRELTLKEMFFNDKGGKSHGKNE